MVAGLVAAVLLVASQAGCGEQPEAVPDVATTAAQLDELEIDITGNVAERKAAELLNYHRVEGGIADCMRAAGRGYRQLPYVSYYDDFTDADLGIGNGRGTVVDSMTQHGRRLVLNETALARLARAGVLKRKVAPADQAALDTCAAPFQNRGYHDFAPPAGVTELSGLQELLDPVHRDPAVVKAMTGYQACMKQRYGFTVKERAGFLFAPRLDRRYAPLPGKPVNPRWRKGVTTVDKVFTADAECRRTAYQAGMTLLAKNIGPWKEKNRDKIFAIRAGWRKTVSDAERLSQ